MLDIACYEPPTVKSGSPLDPANPDILADGVQGYAVIHRGEIYILLIQGDGEGKVGMFLDSLSHRCVVVNAMNPKLKGMLVRRNWECSYSDDGADEWRRKLGC
jgi:hypothetical protein